MDRKVRDSSGGYLFVVGGPGGSGCSVISQMLAEHFDLELIYAGSFFRDAVKKRGYDYFEDFYKQNNKDLLLELDEEVDKRLVCESKRENILMDSKAFAGISHIKDIPCTVKIWVTASLHTRSVRHLGKRDMKNGFKKFLQYFVERKNLKKRWRMDRKRYFKLYGLDYSKPELYNDIVVDSSNMDEFETFNLILKKINDGGYLERKGSIS